MAKKLLTNLNEEQIKDLIKLAEDKRKQVEGKLPKYLAKENDIRVKYGMEKVEAVTPIAQFPKCNKKHATKLAKNSLNYFTYVSQIEVIKKFIEKIALTRNEFLCVKNCEALYQSYVNSLNNQYDNYLFSCEYNNIRDIKQKDTDFTEKDELYIQKKVANLKTKIESLDKVVKEALAKKNLPENTTIEKVPVTVKKLYTRELSEAEVEENKFYEELVNNIFDLHKYQIRKACYEMFVEKVKEVGVINARTYVENKYESMMCDDNYQLGQYHKKKQLIMLNDKEVFATKQFEDKVESLKVVQPVNERVIAKLEKQIAKLNKQIDGLTAEMSKYLKSDFKYKTLFVQRKNKIQKRDSLNKELDFTKKGYSIKNSKKIDQLSFQHKRMMAGITTKKKNAGNKSGALLRVMELLKPYKIQLIVLVVVIILNTALQITGPVLMNNFFSTDYMPNYFEPIGMDGVANINFANLFKVFGILVGVYFVTMIFNFLTEFIASKLGGLLAYQLRKKIKNKIDTLPLAYFDSNPLGDVLSRVTNDTDVISQSIHQVISQTFKSVFLLFGVTISMLVVQWQLALIALATLPFALLIVAFVATKSQKQFMKVQVVTGEINGQIEEIYGGFNVIKLFNQEQNVQNKFGISNVELQKSGMIAQFLSGTIQPLLNMVHNIGYVFVCVVGGLLGNTGSIVSFFVFLNLFQQPIQQAAQISNIFQQVSAASSRVFEVLDAKEEVEDKKDAIKVNSVKGEVNFENVDFSYSKNVPLIENMNLKVNPGDSIAIVGPTGAGKTTLVNLIMRFYDVTGGSLKIDGIDIRDYSRNSIRKQIGMVLQDTWLFNGTIAENISYGKDNATREEIIEASKKARAHHFIQTLENGYDTVINEEGSNISQGQKQLITIARAILSNPSIMILDEATSSVDTRTEKALQDAMNDLMVGRTSFVIAHRLSTIKNSKLIIVMNKGHIVEFGNHKELLAKKGFYADLYNSQFMGSVNSSNLNDTDSPAS